MSNAFCVQQSNIFLVCLKAAASLSLWQQLLSTPSLLLPPPPPPLFGFQWLDGKNWRVKSLCDWYLNPSKTFKCKSFSVFVDLFSLLTAENHFLDAHKMSPKIQLSLSLCRWLFSLQSSMWMNVEILPHDYAYIS